MAYSGVFPVFDLIFKINTTPTSTATMASIADMETFGMAIDGNIEEWTPMDTEGWVRRLATGKGFVMSLNGKRNVGDVGNDYVHSLAFKTGRVLSTDAEIDFPDGSKLAFKCVVNVTNTSTGDSTVVGPLEFELQSDGKPTYTEAT
jgi:hypothetical protein